jgi:predicted TIM-barrel fold metal-dependent hydrolase
MRIDIHKRFWRCHAIRDSWIADERRGLERGYLRQRPAPPLGANRIDAAVAVQADQSEDETSLPFDFRHEHRAERGSCSLIGSDWPVCLLAESYDRVKGLVAEFVRGARRRSSRESSERPPRVLRV